MEIKYEKYHGEEKREGKNIFETIKGKENKKLLSKTFKNIQKLSKMRIKKCIMIKGNEKIFKSEKRKRKKNF